MKPRPDTQATQPAIEFRAHPELGTLAWVTRTTEPSAEDRIVTTAFQFLVDPAGLGPARARELARTLGRQVDGSPVHLYLDAFSHLGIGRLKLEQDEPERATFVGEGLRGAQRPNATACAFALGFLEGAMETRLGRATLGAEIRCASHGHPACTFVVMRRDNRPAAQP